MNRIPSPNEGGPREELREARGYLRPEDDGRERRRTGNANVDPFNIDDIVALYCPNKWRIGQPQYTGQGETDLEWKRFEVYGKPDYAEQRGYQDQGWKPVDHSMFPDRFAPVGTRGPVVVKDMILMERPMRLTIQARREEMNLATRAMQVNRQRIAETPEGQAPRIVLADRTTREAIEIPE